MLRRFHAYKALSKWCGWWGGWGSESDIADLANEQAAQGWRLVSTKSQLCAWFWFVPRKKILLVFEKLAPA
jgi:hypothetical protein